MLNLVWTATIVWCLPHPFKHKKERKFSINLLIFLKKNLIEATKPGDDLVAQLWEMLDATEKK